jgi:heterodisulfide reductase subunit A-like polyferredoxin
MAVAKAARLEPLYEVPVPVEKSALVLGGGVAGMTTALSLAEQGFPVHLVERTGELGGNLRHLFFTPPLQQGGREGDDPQIYLRQLVSRVEEEPLISVYLNTELVEHGGFRGNFTSRLRRFNLVLSGAEGNDGGGVEEFEVRHGVTVVATGGQEYRGKEYLYGEDRRVMTGQEFEALLAAAAGRGARPPQERASLALADWRVAPPQDVVMILCVGPAEKYCGRICCTTALKNALKLKELNPDARITVLFKDIRTYGFKERLYTRTREKGVLFLRYDDEHRPQVETVGDNLQVRAWEPTLGLWITLTPDLLVLSNPVMPSEGAEELAAALKVPRDLDGFFLEAHVKLRPVDFATDGIYLAGLAHYPKFINEAVVQARAAAARAATILSQKELHVGGVVATVKAEKCTGCLTCVRICPYDVPHINPTKVGAGRIMGVAEIEAAACQGCGICPAECPAKAIQLQHYRDEQVLAKEVALFEELLAA